MLLIIIASFVSANSRRQNNFEVLLNVRLCMFGDDVQHLFDVAFEFSCVYSVMLCKIHNFIWLHNPMQFPSPLY